jgi:hypothetical protein
MQTIIELTGIDQKDISLASFYLTYWMLKFWMAQ